VTTPRGDVARSIRSKVIVDDGLGCWLYATGRYGRHGSYASMHVDGRSQLVHRISYQAFVGPIPVGYEIDHLCHVPRCCNPDHLEAVTAHENTQRAHAHRRWIYERCAEREFRRPTPEESLADKRAWLARQTAERAA
jgi:hypothetical protein